MSKALAKLLSNDHPLFVFNVQTMERASGNAGIDARLIAETTEQAHTVMRSLGLDVHDTSAEELYHTLSSIIMRGESDVLRGNESTLLVVNDEVVSFNLLDVIENAHHQLPFEKRRVDHAQRHLRAELIKRYAEHDRTSDEMIHKLAEQAEISRADDVHFVDIDTRLRADQADVAVKAPSLLMIGDIFTDAFIKLNENSAKIIKEEDGKEWLALPFGQKPPYDQVDIVRSVGPSPNAAVSASRLGLDVSLMAWVGDDDVGREALAHLKQERVGVSPMVVEPNKQTSYWYVLRYGADRTMLVKSEQYTYAWTRPERVPDWVYLSYVGADSWTLHEQLLSYLEENPTVKLAFQPGTFHFEWGPGKLAGIYRRSHIVIMNREEAVDVTEESYDDIQGLAVALHKLGPSIAVITDGPNGSYASFDGRLVTIPNYPDPADPLDRTGAGDAFASTIVSALALGESMDEALTWAPINSMSVVQQLGAQAGLLTRAEIQRYLLEAPEQYKVTEI